MKKLGKTEKFNNYRIRFNFPFFRWGGGGVRLSKSKYGFFSMSGTATLLSKYGTAVKELIAAVFVSIFVFQTLPWNTLVMIEDFLCGLERPTVNAKFLHDGQNVDKRLPGRSYWTIKSSRLVDVWLDETRKNKLIKIFGCRPDIAQIWLNINKASHFR